MTDDPKKADNTKSEAKKNAEDAAEKTAQKAEQVAQDAKQQAEKSTQDAKERAGDIKDKVKAQAQDAKNRAQAEAAKGFEQGKGRVVSQVSSVAQAFRKTGEQLRDEDQDDLAGYTERIADEVEKVSGYLEGKSLRDVMGDVETFARQRPSLFVGGALALGLVAARFLRSSSSHSADANTSYDPNR